MYKLYTGMLSTGVVLRQRAYLLSSLRVGDVGKAVPAQRFKRTKCVHCKNTYAYFLPGFYAWEAYAPARVCFDLRGYHIHNYNVYILCTVITSQQYSQLPSSVRSAAFYALSKHKYKLQYEIILAYYTALVGICASASSGFYMSNQDAKTLLHSVIRASKQ